MDWLRRFVGALFALVVLFEEWGWDPLQRMMARLMRWPPLAWLERHIAALPPWPALAVFVVPTLGLLPLKLLALWLIGHGESMMGVLLIVGAKLVGTAVVARLFALTQPALMRMPWFAAVYTHWVVWKTSLLERVRASWVWRTGRVIRRRLRRRWAR
jgi:hypothetical protein